MSTLRHLMTAVKATNLTYRLISTTLLIGQIIYALSIKAKKNKYVTKSIRKN